MGLMDRDYMRERAQERSRSSSSGVQGLLPLSILSLVCLTLAYLYYGRGTASEPVRIGPLAVTISGERVPAAPGASGVQTASPSADEQVSGTIVPPTGLVMEDVEGASAQVQMIPQAFPESGSVMWMRPPSPGEPMTVLRISDGSGIPGNKVVRLRDAFGQPVAQIYVRDQEGAILQVSQGRYQMNVMIGQTWYGPTEQFGGMVTFHRGMSMPVTGGGADYMLMPPGRPRANGMVPIDASSF